MNFAFFCPVYECLPYAQIKNVFLYILSYREACVFSGSGHCLSLHQGSGLVNEQGC